MNRHIASQIAARLSLRAPQRRSLEILDQITELIPLHKGADPTAALAAIRDAFPSVTDFEHAFPSFCFALATGVGKTRLMGAFVAYLHRAHGLNNFFVLAPGLTIYRKLITDFTPGTPKYVLRGISEFAASPPSVLTAENYERHFAGALSLSPVTIHIFNISKISAEVRGGRPLRIRSFREGLGTSYFDYLSSLPDLVLIMDEAHHYRASAGLRALNELDPLIGLELTATPSVQRGGGSQEFNNIVLEYCIAQAIEGGLVKIPAVITRENFVAAGMAPDELERIKLEDGVRLHEHVKAELKAYAHETGKPLIKPVLLVIAKHTRHASKLIRLIKSADFFEGCYAGKVLQVDSSVNEDEAVQRLLRIESVDEPTEIVIHVNMLKEGWDVANLFTIVPLRAAQARTLIVQSIGRGLRLPYGERTGNPTLDRVAIVAHDRFQEFVDEARKPDFPFRLQQDVLNEEQLRGSLQTITSSPLLHILLGLAEPAFGMPSGFQEDQAFYGANARSIAKVAYGAAHDLGRGPNALPCMAHLQRPDTRHALTETVRKLSNQDLSCSFAEEIVSKAIDLIVRYSIDIPRIDTDAPDRQKLEIHPFVVDFAEMHWPPPSDTLWASYLQSGETERIAVTAQRVESKRPIEDVLVDALITFDDVSYDEHADLIYDLARQVIRHLASYLRHNDVVRVLRLHCGNIARLLHAQMQDHMWRTEPNDTVQVASGFVALKTGAHTAPAGDAPLDFRKPPPDLGKISRHVFERFSRCLYAIQKFQSDPERRLAIILDRDALKWFKPVRGQMLLSYRARTGWRDYQPDFLAETAAQILLLEVKALNEMGDADVVAKRDAAIAWCTRASAHARTHGGKPWTYALIPDQAITENMTIAGLVDLYGFA